MGGFSDELPSDDNSDKKKKTKAKEQVYIGVNDVDGMNLFDKVAGYKSAIKIIQGELEIVEETLKDNLRERFVETSMKTKTKPDSIEAQGDMSSATISFKKGISVLDKQTVEDFKSRGINVSVVEKVSFKKSVLDDEQKVQEIIDLMKKNGFKIGDYFDRTEKVVPSDRTVNDILDKVDDPAEVESYFRKVSTIAIGSPNFDGDSLKAKEKIVNILDESGIFKV
jgi:hypothetical protein